MTLSTHAVFGAAAAVAISPRNPVLAFAIGFCSHFLLDAFPHGHYRLESRTNHPENRLAEDMVFGKNLFIDLIKVAFDFFLGLGLAYLLFGSQDTNHISLVLLGAFAGMLPDGLQFLYFKMRTEPLISLQKFHVAVHAEKSLNHDMTKTILVELAAMLAGFILYRLLGA